MNQDAYSLNNHGHHKTIAYIIIGIIVILILAYYIYVVLSNAQQAQMNQSTAVNFSAAQAAQKTAAIDNAMSGVVTLSPKQSAAKAALLEKMGAAH